MFDYLPPYIRGQSIAGYVAGCRSGRLITNAIPSITDRSNICRDHAEQIRVAIRQPV